MGSAKSERPAAATTLVLLLDGVEAEADGDEQIRRSWRRRAQSSPPLARSSGECKEKATLRTLSPCGAARRHSRGAGGGMRARVY